MLYLDGISVPEVGLCVQDDAVALLEDQVAVGDKDVALPPDHDDDGLAGDVQLPDGQAVPGVLTAQHHLLQVDVLVVPQGLGPQYQGVAGAELHAAPGHNNFSVALNGGHNDAGGQAQLHNGLSHPGVLWEQGDLDKVDI